MNCFLTKKVTVAREVTTSCELVFAPETSLEGFVRFAGLPHQADVRVQTNVMEEGVQIYHCWGETDDAGRFRVEGIPPGQYGLSVSLRTDQGKEKEERILEIVPGMNRVNVDLGEDATAVIEGRILGLGSPPGEYSVSIRTRTLNRQAVTAPDGAFRLEGLPAGDWSLRVTPKDRARYGNWYRTIEVILAEGETKYLEIPLLLGTASLTGVLREDGKVLDRGRIEVMAVDPSSGGTFMKSAWIQDGQWCVDRLPAGIYIVSFSATLNACRRVTVGEGETLQVDHDIRLGQGTVNIEIIPPKPSMETPRIFACIANPGYPVLEPGDGCEAWADLAEGVIKKTVRRG